MLILPKSCHLCQTVACAMEKCYEENREQAEKGECSMRKGGIIFLYTLFICVIVIAGCDRQQGTVISENTVYYAYRETGSM